MYFANELEKLHYFSIFICISRKNVVYLHPQFHAGDVCASSAGVADIFKRRLLTLCSDVFETSQLSKASSGLSNDRCPTGYRLSLLCLLISTSHAHICAHACTIIQWHKSKFIFGVGFSVVGSKMQAMRRPRKRGTTIVGLHAFFIFMLLKKLQIKEINIL